MLLRTDFLSWIFATLGLQYDIRPEILDLSLHCLRERVLLAVNHLRVVE
jgi:hypothetical protein